VNREEEKKILFSSRYRTKLPLGGSLTAKAIVVLSGGQDSTTCLYFAKFAGYEIHAITFNYGQRHQLEIEAAQHIAMAAGCESHEIINLGPSILVSSSPLVSTNPLEQYKDHQSLPGGLEKTFIPMRNQLFLTIAMNRAAHRKALSIFTGVCEEDYGGYPDCRQSFIDEIEIASNKALFGDYSLSEMIHIRVPLMDLKKADTVKLALDLPGCYEALKWTHTSYDGEYPPVGHDHATLLRAKGFIEANVPDPLIMRAYKEGKMHLPDTPNYFGADSVKLGPWFERARIF